MPEYKFICDNCKENFAIDKKISEYNPKEPCPKCGNPMKRDVKDFCGEYVCKTSGFYGKSSN